MEFTFLGTSAGSPTKRRNVTSLALRLNGGKHWYMIDCGEGTQHQLLHTKYSLNTVKAIFITHVHGDHCYGLPGVLASASMSGRTIPLTIVGPAPIGEMLKTIQQTTELWLDYELIFIDVAQQQQPLCFNDIEVEPLKLSHRVPCFGYTITESRVEQRLDKDKLIALGIDPSPLWGLLQKGQDVTTAQGHSIKAQDVLLTDRAPRVIFVGGDNDTPSLLDNASQRPDVVIHEATYTQEIADKVGPGPQHSSAKMIAQYAQLAKVANLVLTHVSPRYGYNPDVSPSIKDIEHQAQQYYQGHLFLANDFDHYQLNKDHQLHFHDNCRDRVVRRQAKTQQSP